MNEELRKRYLQAMDIPIWKLRHDNQSISAIPDPELILAPNAPKLTDALAVTDSNSVPQQLITTIPSADYTSVVTNIPTTNAGVDSVDWDELATLITQCSKCDELVANRSRTVFGVGNRHAKLLVVGEAPGADEDRQGEPFVGKAGQLLNAMLNAIGLKREDVYIANILKCRPPNNREPHQNEAANCERFLLRQIELLGPKLILAAGRISAQNLLKTQVTVGKLRGVIHKYGKNDIPLVVTYHPAYLLRSPGQKAEAWKDLQVVVKILQQS